MSFFAMAFLLANLTAPANRVVIISVDGLRADAVQHMPTVKRLIQEGAATLDARPDARVTYTLPNHLCMVTGRPVLGAEGHRYTRNSKGGASVHTQARRYLASVFDQVHDHGGSVLLMVGKAKLGQFGDWWGPGKGAPDRVPPDDGQGKIDRAFVLKDAEVATQAARVLATEPPTLLFLHFAGPDRAGHLAGFDPAGQLYRESVVRTDAHIGRVLSAVPPRTLVLVTTDHGGVGRGHGKPAHPEVYTIPFVAWGAGVRAGVDLYAINPAHNPAKAPIRNCMVGNTALTALGLPVIPGAPMPAVQLK
jgi:predicted AlkP superfamily pyrophosphatase or phosphodiesterase